MNVYKMAVPFPKEINTDTSMQKMSLSIIFLLQFVYLKSLAIRTTCQMTSKWPLVRTKYLLETNQLDFKVFFPALVSCTPALMEFSPASISVFTGLINS